GPTLGAVAARAGVSRATVSRVVNGGDGVREPLAERVRQAVDELGYVPNQAARSLVTKRHDAIAVIVAEPEARVFADPFFARQLRGISKELTAHDNQLVLLLTEGRHDHARDGCNLAGGHVDGALVFSLHLDDPLPELVQRAGDPTVFGGRPGWTGGRGEDVVYVARDNRGGAGTTRPGSAAHWPADTSTARWCSPCTWPTRCRNSSSARASPPCSAAGPAGPAGAERTWCTSTATTAAGPGTLCATCSASAAS